MAASRHDGPLESASSASGLHGLASLEARFLRPARVRISLALAALILQALLVLPLPWLQGLVIDQLGAGSDLSRLLILAAVLPLVCLLGRVLLGWYSGLVMASVSLEFVRSLTDSLHQKLQRLPLAWFDRHETGQVISRLTSDVGTLLICLNANSLQLVADLVLAGGVLVLLAVLCWPLAAISLAAVPLFWWNQRWHGSRLTASAAAVQEHNAAACAFLSERLSAVRAVRATGSQPRELASWNARLDGQVDSGRANLHAVSAQYLTSLLIGGTSAGFMVCLAALLLRWQWLTRGDAVAFLTYLGLVYQPLVRLAQFSNGFAATLAAVARIAEVLDEPEPQAAVPRPSQSTFLDSGRLEFENVSFRHAAADRLALHGVCLVCEPGQTVGICGPSGAGKSTLLSLVPRLYELPSHSGRILLAGREVRDFPWPQLRRQVCYVPQQARLFSGTIRSNLLYGAGDASESWQWRVLEAVLLADFVGSLPQGLETRVGERGASLSGGQRQRLALARALLMHPQVLLLDDCLSALDASTAVQVRDNLVRWRPEQTCLMAAPDPQALAVADWLVALDGGQVVWQGRPRDMLAVETGQEDRRSTRERFAAATSSERLS